MDDSKTGGGMTAQECSIKTCSNPARVKPRLKFYAHRKSTPAEAVLNIPLCGACSIGRIVGDVMTESGWLRIRALFAAKNKKAPKRRLTRLDFVDLSYGPGLNSGPKIGIGT
jgi:hypothetical protein